MTAHRMFNRRPRATFAISLAIALGGVAAFGQEASMRFALIVGHNSSLDEGMAPLSYADDDAARTFELMSAAGADVVLFTLLDPQSQRRYASAARAAQIPTRAAVMAGAQELFVRMRAAREKGREVHFYFVYSGHGNVGPNNEGYVNLHDTRLRRSELYRELIAPSPASFNHLIIDACHAEQLVRKRGTAVERAGNYRSAARDFLQLEDLSSYPNTGVLFATSSASETHEWSQWESGIFSHELRSGLLGAADVDSDGLITYDEAAAFIEAANSAVDIPRARLRAFSRPPPARTSVALFDVTTLRTEASVRVGAAQASKRYYVEDSRGIRVADFHPSAEQSAHVALVGQAPFFLRFAEQEAKISAPGQTDVAALSFEPVAGAHRGSAEVSFRRHLFEVPFGVGFYRGATARSHLDEATMLSDSRDTAGNNSSLRTWGIGLLAAGAAAALCGATTFGGAAINYEAYSHGTDLTEVRRLRQATERLTAAAIGCSIGAATLLGTGAVMFGLAGKPSPIALGISPVNQGLNLSLSGYW